jgi:DNA-binding NarL/FixJ family response regulator
MTQAAETTYDKPFSVLLVDDHEVVREGIARVLGRKFTNCKVGNACSYGEAVDAIHANSWDMVITDLSINGRGGIDLIQELIAIRKNLPVLVFSMHDEQDYGIRAIKSGAAGYVRKGAGVSVLLEAIGMVLSGKRYISPELSQSLVSYVTKDTDRPLHEKLSDREFQVLQRIAKGVTLKEIGGELHLSVKTISTYRARILSKLGLTNFAEIMRYCIKHSIS